jgi:hypothetical protein
MIRIVRRGWHCCAAPWPGNLWIPARRDALSRDELEQAGRPKTREFAAALPKAGSCDNRHLYRSAPYQQSGPGLLQFSSVLEQFEQSISWLWIVR